MKAAGIKPDERVVLKERVARRTLRTPLKTALLSATRHAELRACD
jgi:hypothetical protein